ncbi:MAG: Hsp70 suppressor, GTPase facilitates ribosomal subunit dissociation [Chrysothrix sp. TS-e1954]|nr:MAG: Hsp70 suppressor, GTPase facilitates ribosomal subunit dissociation [Chrysothrix sp. TS-e1954]
MSSHRRVKDIEYDEDDLDDYDESYETARHDDVMSEEDKEQLRQGTASVRAALDTNIDDVTDKEIEEALWYYYFDVGKSVAYIQKQRAPASTEPRKQKEPSRFEQAAQKAKSKSVNGTVLKKVLASDSPLQSQHAPHNFFWDTPWLRVAPERLSNMSLERQPVRVGLLGGSAQVGSGKPSKLAALAATRRKAAEEKKKSQATEPTANKRDDMNASVQQLDKLDLQSKPSTRANGEAHSDGCGMSTHESQQPSEPRTYRRKNREEPKDQVMEEAPEPERPAKKHKPEPEITFEDDSQPSRLAWSIFGDLSLPWPARPPDKPLFTLCNPSRPAGTKDPFSGPSPDAVVLSAQSRDKTRTTPSSDSSNTGKTSTTASSISSSSTDKQPPKTTPTKATNGVNDELNDGFDGFNISGPNGGTSTPSRSSKHKHLDITSELAKAGDQKPTANFVVVGHVDHGKSTLMGRLLHDLKLLNSRQFQKLSREAEIAGKSSFHLAWVMDSTAEERARGITVDIATNHFETERTRYTILDAPGHRDFIPNMIAGASQADFAVLVVDAGTNAFEAGLKGQTKEHALLVRSMGISRLVVAINKMDSASWSQNRFDTISHQLTSLLTAAGFSQKSIDFIPCAGLSGINVALPPTSTSSDSDKPPPMPWYTGPTLVDALDASAPSTRNISSPLRLTVSDVFKPPTSAPTSATLCVTGRIDAGSLQPGEQLLLQPVNQPATLKAITLPVSASTDSKIGADAEESVEYAVAGQSPTLYLIDLAAEHVATIRPGDSVSSALHSPVRNTQELTLKLLTFEHILPGPVELHKGRLHVAGRIAELVALLDKGTGEVEKRRPRVLKPGVVGRVRVLTELAVPVEVGARCVVRSEGVSLGAGLVEGVDG